MKNKEYLYVIDYGKNGIYEIDLTDIDDTETEDMDLFLKRYGLKADNCYTMFSSEKLYIERIEKIE